MIPWFSKRRDEEEPQTGEEMLRIDEDAADTLAPIEHDGGNNDWNIQELALMIARRHEIPEHVVQRMYPEIIALLSHYERLFRAITVAEDTHVEKHARQRMIELLEDFYSDNAESAERIETLRTQIGDTADLLILADLQMRRRLNEMDGIAKDEKLAFRSDDELVASIVPSISLQMRLQSMPAKSVSILLRRFRERSHTVLRTHTIEKFSYETRESGMPFLYLELEEDITSLSYGKESGVEDVDRALKAMFPGMYFKVSQTTPVQNNLSRQCPLC